MEEQILRTIENAELKDIFAMCKKDETLRIICRTTARDIIEKKLMKLEKSLSKSWGGMIRDLMDRMGEDELIKITPRPPSDKRSMTNKKYPYAVCQYYNNDKELFAGFIRGFSTLEEADSYAFSLAVLRAITAAEDRDEFSTVITLDQLPKDDGPGERYNPYRKQTVSGYSASRRGLGEMVYVAVKWFDGVLNDWDEFEQFEGKYTDNKWRPRYINPFSIEDAREEFRNQYYDDDYKDKRTRSSSSSSSPKTKKMRHNESSSGSAKSMSSSPKTEQKRRRSSGSSSPSAKRLHTSSGSGSSKNSAKSVKSSASAKSDPQQKRRRSSASPEGDELVSLLSKKMKL